MVIFREIVWPFFLSLVMVSCVSTSEAQNTDWRNQSNYQDCLTQINDEEFSEASFQIKDLYCQIETATKSADYTSADQFLATMDSLLARETDSMFVMKVKLGLGQLHRMQERYELAFIHFTEALRYFKKHQEYDEWGLTLVRLAEYYRVLKRFDLANSHLELAIDLNERAGPLSPRTLSTLWHRRAAISVELREPVEQAIAFSEKSLSYSEPLDLKEDMATSYLELGYIYYNLKDPKAEDLYKKALFIWRYLGLKHYEANTLFNLARLHYSIGEVDDCLDYLNQILELNKTHQLHDAEYDALYLMSEISMANGDYKGALEMREKANKILLESLKNQHDIAIAMISKQYESDLTKRQLELAQSEVVQAETDAKTQRRIQAFFAVLLIVVIGLGVTLFIFYRRLQFQTKEVSFQREKIEEQNRELTRSLLEKETLLQEVHHRVQNNLQFILALIEMQANSEDDGETKLLLSEFSQRVMAIALVHEQLHIQNKSESVTITRYINKLIETLEQLIGAKERPIDFEVNVESIQLDVTRAVAIGMILNELVTNSMKYAFHEEKRPKICVKLRENASTSEIQLEYTDNGSGFERAASKGLGSRLIDMFGRRLKGQQELSSENGIKYRITFTR